MLFLRRRKPPNEGLFNAPGGKIESHEDPYEACLRELHEETGLRVRELRLRAILTVVTRTTGAQWLLFVFVADRPPGPADPIATDEGELRWIPIEEIARVPVPSDIPLIAPHLFGPQGGILMGKIHADNDDADSMLSHVFRNA